MDTMARALGAKIAEAHYAWRCAFDKWHLTSDDNDRTARIAAFEEWATLIQMRDRLAEMVSDEDARLSWFCDTVKGSERRKAELTALATV